MIKVDRSKFAEPLQYAEAAARAFEELKAAHAGLGKVKQSRLPFNEKVWRMLDLRQALLKVFNGCCAFCESPLSPSERNYVSLFRPRERAMQLDGEVSVEHYWWLAYRWENLYSTCGDCSSHKGSRFPVNGRRAAPHTDHSREAALLLDPCVDNPENQLLFSEQGTVEGTTEKARITIDVFGLNRMSLVERRRDVCGRVDNIGDAFLTDNNPEKWTAPNFVQSVLMEAPDDWGFRALIRQQAIRHLQRAQAQVAGVITPAKAAPSAGSAPQRLEVSGVIGVAAGPDEMRATKAAAAPSYRPTKAPRAYEGAIWLHRIEIENFKALRDFQLQFSSPAPAFTGFENANVDFAQDSPSVTTGESQPWIMLLGENGVGKSTLLKAIAYALMPARQREKLAPDPRQWVTRGRGATAGSIRLHFTVGAEPLELQFSSKSRRVVVKGDAPDMAVLGYGSTRLLPPAATRLPRPESVRVQNLFNSRAPLRDAERWLASGREVVTRDFDLLATSLKLLLSLGDEDEISRHRHRLFATVNNDHGPIRDLSDGYQSVLGLALDMMLNLSHATFDMEGVEGVVLLDELEVHLHPRWKIQIVAALRKLFPRVRFIATTHDPLCVQGLRKGELHIMTRQGADKDVKIEQFDVPPGARADQILTGAWFGVPTTRDPETAAMMREHSALLQKKQKSLDDELRFDFLDKQLRVRLDEYIGTEDEQIALQAAAEVRAENRARAGAPGAASAAELREKVREALRSKPAAAGN
jgi:uncharacterized protein (TIGR02646 family)